MQQNVYIAMIAYKQYQDQILNICQIPVLINFKGLSDATKAFCKHTAMQTSYSPLKTTFDYIGFRSNHRISTKMISPIHLTCSY